MQIISLDFQRFHLHHLLRKKKDVSSAKSLKLVKFDNLLQIPLILIKKSVVQEFKLEGHLLLPLPIQNFNQLIILFKTDYLDYLSSLN